MTKILAAASALAREYHKSIAVEALHQLTGKKLETLHNALYRNLLLTSARTLSSCDCIVYEEGWYFKFTGTRSSFNLFVYNRNGALEIASRKPSDNALNMICTKWLSFDEVDFDGI